MPGSAPHDDMHRTSFTCVSENHEDPSSVIRKSPKKGKNQQEVIENQPKNTRRNDHSSKHETQIRTFATKNSYIETASSSPQDSNTSSPTGRKTKSSTKTSPPLANHRGKKTKSGLFCPPPEPRNETPSSTGFLEP